MGIRIDIGCAGTYQPYGLHAGVRERCVAREFAQAFDSILEGVHHNAEILCIQLIYRHIVSIRINDDYKINQSTD